MKNFLFLITLGLLVWSSCSPKPDESTDLQADSLAAEQLANAMLVTLDPSESVRDMAERIKPDSSAYMINSLAKGVIGDSLKCIAIAYTGYMMPETNLEMHDIWALIEERDKPYRFKKYMLPKTGEQGYNDWMGKPVFDAISIFFADTDTDSQNEMLVIVHVTGNSVSASDKTVQYDNYFTDVYDWNGTGFVYQKSVSDLLDGATTPDEVNKKLGIK